MLRNLILILGGAVALSSVAAPAEQPYQFLREIPIGGEGGWDILTVDANRLYLSHATKVEIVDLEKNAVIGEIADTPGVHDFVAVPELSRGFSSNGTEAKVGVVDLKTRQTVSKIETGDGPDAMAYDPARSELYVFNHRGNSATVIDAKNLKVVATIPLSGSPEFAAVDSAAGRVYCNIESKNEVAVIDATKHEVTASWPVTPGDSPTGIALDAEHHRLFVACHNRLLLMLDTQSGEPVSAVRIADGNDGCAFDVTTQLVFASCGDGTTTIARAEAPARLAVVQVLKTQRGARTIALDPATHRIYLPTAEFEPAPPASPGVSPQRPKIVPNTLKLLVYGPAP